ncbi:MAG TPA: isochorismate synthase [Oscillatoriales cyanobacterium M59_W2019_021]|nr:MAG: isochorismate synthase [Cyanobacteria bacterium J055]HIK33499.1 isochorismate synthase [Oscillatoriales cyanobacterium M4454_W2019_049]HIK51797.1 isochorismate synthase [Oscillatoriales cyanobacterium M59_W2019_021]
MPVKPEPKTLFQDCQELQQFLLSCRQLSRQKQQPQLVSISWEVPKLDPLAVFQKIFRDDRLHFYFESPSQDSAIAAIDSEIEQYARGADRFSTLQSFIESCWDNILTVGDLDLPFSGSHFFCGFTFFDRPSPFNSLFPSAIAFLPKWQVARQGDRSVLVFNTEIDTDTDIPFLCHQAWKMLETIRSTQSRVSQSPMATDLQFNWQDIDRFKTSVLSALNSIEADRLRKIVLSHAIELIKPIPFDLCASLDRLRTLYPDCYIFSFGNGRGRNFIGASPERLLKITDRQLIADALAGSAPRGSTPSEDAAFANRLLSSQKEQHEHQVVLDFIIRHLSRLGLTVEPTPPMRLLQLSNIQHLWTPIQARVPACVRPLQIVSQLHPTPAVAGEPRSIACEEIRRYEAFDRSLYAAPLGWIDRHGNSEFIVGIRSAFLEGCRAQLYAGAGIVSGSDPQKELAEIQLKFQALIKALV